MMRGPVSPPPNPAGHDLGQGHRLGQVMGSARAMDYTPARTGDVSGAKG